MEADTPATQSPIHGVVLSGGGARGAYQVGVLSAIVDILGDGMPPLPVVCGTSAGAVNAAVLASHARDPAHAVRRLEHFWSSLRCQRIYRTDAATVLVSAVRWFLALASAGLIPVSPRSLLDNEPLRELLSGELRLDGIDDAVAEGALRGVAITASAYTRASAISFYQGAPDLEPWRRTRRCGESTRLGVDHVMASVALPFVFPAQRLGNEFYGDGGMRMGAPLSPAIHLGANRLLVIATRDERPDPAPDGPAEYPGAGEVGGYLLDTVFMDTLNADIARLDRVNRTLALLDDEQRTKTGLQHIDTLVIRPSEDVRTITAAHAGAMPISVRMLLRALGGWGKDWRMASYLLFEAEYCRALIELGRKDGQNAADDIRAFFNVG